MRELIKKDQLVTIIPQNYKEANNGRVLHVDLDGFRMELKYKPDGLIINHICDFYSLTDNGYLYFESYIKNIENNVVTISNPVKHRFLQRRKFTRVKFLEEMQLVSDTISHEVRSLDISAGGMKLQTKENIDIEKIYNVNIKLNNQQEIYGKYQIIRIEKKDNGYYILSGRFINLSNIDKMTLIQYCMKKDMENLQK